MGNKDANPIIIIVAVVIAVALLGYFGYRASQPPTPSPSAYTPGVPPWLDKKHPNTSNVHAPPGQGAQTPR